MSNIRKAFEHGQAFIPFITCGDPDLETTGAAVRAAAANGADLIELGIPFSDPTAEGPVIQAANVRALAGGVTTDRIFELVKDLRRDVTVPMVFMTYANVVFSYGAEKFIGTCEEVGIDGIILTKLDGDSRGGAALSIRSVTGKPIYYAGMGEKLEALEPFHPDRMASRILGMGDVLSLVEKAQATFDMEEAKAMEKKLRKDEFTLDDFLSQMQQVKKLGSLESILGMIPGMGGLKKQLEGQDIDLDGKEMRQIEAIIKSMTPKERADITIINGSRRKRIAMGSGTRVQDVNRLLKQFGEMRKMMKKMKKMQKGKKGGFPGLGALGGLGLPKMPFMK